MDHIMHLKTEGDSESPEWKVHSGLIHLENVLELFVYVFQLFKMFFGQKTDYMRRLCIVSHGMNDIKQML